MLSPGHGVLLYMLVMLSAGRGMLLHMLVTLSPGRGMLLTYNHDGHGCWRKAYTVQNSRIDG